MPLLSLPQELLFLLPEYLDNIETFTNAASSCRRLRDAFAITPPSTILRLAAASSPTFFSPHPYFLVAATARSASDWALGNEERTTLLETALQGGIYRLYDFCLQHGGLTLDRIRQTHLARFSIINPLCDRIDKMAGKQWLETPNFWHGGVSEAVTLYTDADRATFQIIIYGEIFGRSMDAFLDPQKNLPHFDIPLRFDYFTFCLPDEQVPYDPASQLSTPAYIEDQRALRHITRCKRWRRMWATAIREMLDEGFTDENAVDENWRKTLLRNALQVQGLEGMQLVTCKPGEVSKEYLERARQMRKQIRALEQPPEASQSGPRGKILVSKAPDPATELNVTHWGQWRQERQIHRQN